MAKNIIIGPLTDSLPHERQLEIVERKGLGHPDTLSDHIAEETSKALCNYYIKELGSIMHHNVDKVLLVGGQAEPLYNGGKILKSIELIIAGRAVDRVKDKTIPVKDLATEAAKRSLRESVRHLDARDHVNVEVRIRPGSKDLIELFERFGKGHIPLSNDTSIGTGFYPLDTLEEIVMETERLLNSPSVKSAYPYIGEDIKVMGVRNNRNISLTVAIAMVDKYISSLADYIKKIDEVKEFLKQQEWSESNVEFEINSADDYKNNSVYLTVTGTSAECGDDGQVGRGNRANGLITPYRPMNQEAVAGKNPVNHVGKIYNLFSFDLCRGIVKEGLAEEAYCYIVSQIGKPVNEPLVLDIRLKGNQCDEYAVRDLAEKMLEEMPLIWMKVLKGDYVIA